MKKIISTKNAPTPIGPYSQAVLLGKILYTSGQIAMNPKTGELNIKNINEETHQVMKNLKSVLHAVEMTFDNVIKTSIFISDMNNFNEINEVYGEYFSSNFPARETVEVSCLPKNVNIEISMIASK